MLSSPEQTLVVNGRFLGRPATGVDRFAVEVLKALDQLIASRGLALQLEVLTPPGVRPELVLRHGQVRSVGRHQGHRWEQLELPQHAAGRPLLNLCNTGPVFCRASHVVIHDAAVFSLPQAYGWKFRWAYKIMHRLLAWSGSPLLTVSEFSRQELAHHLGVPAARITVLPESGEHMLAKGVDTEFLRQQGLLSRPYVLAVSSNHLGKNFQFLAEALSAMPDAGFDVVVAGGSNARIFSDRQNSLPSFIKRVGFVSDEALCALYRHARCFVFPSIYEGFGLPPLEAMALGCPVVASRAASIPEVCGTAAEYFDPTDAASLQHALTRVMQEDGAAQAQRVAKALAHAAQWRWQDAASRLLEHLKDQNAVSLAPAA